MGFNFNCQLVTNLLLKETLTQEFSSEHFQISAQGPKNHKKAKCRLYQEVARRFLGESEQQSSKINYNLNYLVTFYKGNISPFFRCLSLDSYSIVLLVEIAEILKFEICTVQGLITQNAKMFLSLDVIQQTGIALKWKRRDSPFKGHKKTIKTLTQNNCAMSQLI